jgi:hypothetical protein
MNGRAFTIASALSLTICAATLALWVPSDKHPVSFTQWSGVSVPLAIEQKKSMQ